MRSRYNAYVVVDSTGKGEPIYEALSNTELAAIPYVFSNASKGKIIDNLAIKIERREARLMDLPVQTNELLAYQYEVTKTAKAQTSAPAGLHDDCVIALALALAFWGIANQTVWEWN